MTLHDSSSADSRLRAVVDDALAMARMQVGAGIPPIRGCLVHGIPGVGKSELVRRVVSGIDTVHLDELSLLASLSDVDQIQRTFNKAKERFAKSKVAGVIFIDDLDVLSTGAEEAVQEWTRSLQHEITHLPPELPPAKVTPGYVARDISQLFRLAALHHLRRQPEDQDKDLASQLDQLSLADAQDTNSGLVWRDFSYTLRTLQPSDKTSATQDEVELPTRNMPRGGRVGGYETLKEQLQSLIHWPMQHAESYQRLGCGKTMLVHELAAASLMNIITVKGPELLSKYLGESEAQLRRLFAQARKLTPCLVFFDEIDSIGVRRDWESDGSSGVNERVLSTLLNEMDGVTARQGVLVVGCTNRPNKIDDAILRPGRLDQLVYMPPPTRDDRLQILQTLTQGMTVDPHLDLKEWAERTEGFTGADLSRLLRDAGLACLARNVHSHTSAIDHQAVEEAFADMGGGQHWPLPDLTVFEQFCQK
ncbi:hypothetical protein RI367_002458 [Sorochytrium milnesiophthora]